MSRVSWLEVTAGGGEAGRSARARRAAGGAWGRALAGAAPGAPPASVLWGGGAGGRGGRESARGAACGRSGCGPLYLAMRDSFLRRNATPSGTAQRRPGRLGVVAGRAGARARPHAPTTGMAARASTPRRRLRNLRALLPPSSWALTMTFTPGLPVERTRSARRCRASEPRSQASTCACGGVGGANEGCCGGWGAPRRAGQAGAAARLEARLLQQPGRRLSVASLRVHHQAAKGVLGGRHG